MNIVPVYFDEQPRRLRGDGKHSITKSASGTVLYWECSGCEWHFSTLLAFRDSGEQAAWMHISRPNLSITGSSDIELPGRLARITK